MNSVSVAVPMRCLVLKKIGMSFFIVVCLCLMFSCGQSNQNYDSLTWQRCHSNEFDCQDGTCISVYQVCDGIRDCSNNADENNDFCEVKNGKCAIPMVSPHMTFELNYSDVYRSRTVPEGVRGTFHCKAGFTSDKGSNMTSICKAGDWTPGIFTCLKPCADLNTTNILQKCFFRGEQVDCNGVLLEGTLAMLSCQEPHHQPNFRETMCKNNGNWSIHPEDIKCHPSCGVYDEESSKIMRNKDFSWRILIREMVGKSEHFFSGTLIDTKLILTDKNAFHRSTNPDDFLIFVNDEIASWGPLKSYKVNEIHFINQHYQNVESPNGLGALVIFETIEVVEYGLTVLPACISLYSHPNAPEILNRTGQVVTVGKANEYKDVYRDEISILNVSSFDCSYLPVDKWYTDQFCGLIENEKSFSDADQGTGLVQKDPKTGLYFLHGVFGVHSESKIMTFTLVTNYIEWIDAVREKVKRGRPVQKKQQLPPKPGSNILILFVLLSFVILIAVLLRGK